MAPGQVGRYHPEQVVGVGSFATVYRARDDWLEDTVALKVLAENHSLNPEVRERFIAEGRSLRRIESPHVVAVHDIGESDRQQPFLVLEYAEHGTLADRVRSLRAAGWSATAADVLVTARALASAIEAVHAVRLVHRDLSPGNVLIASAPPSPGQAGAGPSTGRFGVGEPDPGGLGAGGLDTGGDDTDAASVVGPGERLVVADLGMCKDLARNSGLTVAAGTSGFRPPEQEVGGLVDTRADLWSLSALLEWLCEGADLPVELTAALDRSRAQDPQDRHPDVASWLADLEAAVRPPAAVATPTGPAAAEGDAVPGSAPTAVTSLLPEQPVAQVTAGTMRGRRLGILLVVSVVALVVGVLGGYLLGQGTGAAPAQTPLASVEITGPTDLTVGAAATFTAEVTGLESWVWTLPSGRYVLDAPAITVTPETAGPSHLVLRGQDREGQEIVVEHHLQVRE